jgi:hypothetical protein
MRWRPSAPGHGGGGWRGEMTPICPPPWHYTTFWDWLDHWQSLAAGLVALGAAIVAVGGAEWFARRKERREIEAIRIIIPKLAPYVVAFYGNIEHIRSHVRIATADPAETLNSTNLDEIAALLEQAFQENALPLLNQLPKDMRGLKERIEAMGPAPATTPPPSAPGPGGDGLAG